MKMHKVTVADLSESRVQRAVLPDGVYSLAVAKCELKQSKATQGMLNLQYGICGNEGDPDSVTGSPLFGMVMLPYWEDDATFEASVVAKAIEKGKDATNPDALVEARKEQAEAQCERFAMALFGYDAFPAVPLKDPESKQVMLGGKPFTGSYEDKQVLFAERRAEAVNRIIDIVNGDLDITKYTVYAEVATETYNGETRNKVGAVRPGLRAVDTLLFP